MGDVIKTSLFMKTNHISSSKPLIFCTIQGIFVQETFSISSTLTKELLNIHPNRRTILLENCLGKIVSELPDNAVVKGIDVMFNPVYKVDVLSLLISAYKKKPFSIIWPGVYRDGKLIYAEEGCPDYKVYNVSDYDITCII